MRARGIVLGARLGAGRRPGGILRGRRNSWFGGGGEQARSHLHMLWTGIRTGFLGGKGGPGLAAFFFSQRNGKPHQAFKMMYAHVPSAVDVRNVTEALATCRCFRPTNTSGNGAAVVVV